jgi:hypothetical protein
MAAKSREPSAHNPRKPIPQPDRLQLLPSAEVPSRTLHTGTTLDIPVVSVGGTTAASTQIGESVMGRAHFRRPFLFIGVVARLRFVLNIPVRLEAFDLWKEAFVSGCYTSVERSQGLPARMAWSREE